MKKNVAILIPHLRDGGAERLVSNLSFSLSEEKYEKYIVLFDVEGIDYPYQGNLINLNTKAIDNPLGKVYNVIKKIYRLKKVKKKYNIQITLSFSDSSYGFRPDRNSHQAIKKAKEYMNEEYT